MSSIKLLLITNRYPAHQDDGASPFVSDFVEGLRSRGVDCTVLTPYHQASHYDHDDAVVRFHWGEEKRTIGSLPMCRPTSWLKIRQYMRRGYDRAAALHREKRFDFCLALWAAPSGIFARRLNIEFGLPYAVWCLGSDIHTYARLPILRKIIRDVLVGSARVFCDGYGLGEQAQALAGCECHFLPSLRRVTRLSRSEAVPRENLFVCPGRVERSKGVFDLLEAFGAIASDFPDWSLAYIGDGRARKKLEKLIETSGLGRQVKSLGFLPSDGMFRSIESARAVVIPTWSDSLPLTFGEAMQLERPVIVTDVGDLRRFTERYHVGVVVPPASPAQLAAALRRFIEENRDYGDGFDECVRELDVDVAAERFLAWLADTGVDRVVPAAGVMC